MPKRTPIFSVLSLSLCLSEAALNLNLVPFFTIPFLFQAHRKKGRERDRSFRQARRRAFSI